MSTLGITSRNALPKRGAIQSDFADAGQQFWITYRVQAEEYDTEFSTKLNGDADVSMVFAGLFCGVCATFVVLIQPQLGPDPNDTTHALLAVLILTMNGTIPAGLPVPSPPSPPSSTIAWAQYFLLASLGIALYTSVGSVMGKQWLNHYDSVGIRGSLKERGMERQRKLDALIRWHFRSVLESLPFMLETSLFLFGAGISAYLWDQKLSTGALYMVINAIAAILYVSVIVVAVWYPDCPFQTPLSVRLRRMTLLLRSSWRNDILPSIKRKTAIVKKWFSKVFLPVRAYLSKPARAIWSTVSRCVSRAPTAATAPPHAAEKEDADSEGKVDQPRHDIENLSAESQVQPECPPPRLSQRMWRELKASFNSTFGRTPTSIPSSPDDAQDTQPTPQPPQTSHSACLKLFAWLEKRKASGNATPIPASPPIDPSDAASIAWILDTCTDPSVEAVTLEYILDIDWPQNFDFRPLLDRFLSGFIDCFQKGQDGTVRWTPSLTSRKSPNDTSYGMIFLFLYWHALSISPSNVKGWDCWLNKPGSRSRTTYSFGFVPRDELTYIYLLTMETTNSHWKGVRWINRTLTAIPGPNVLANLSQATAVALSRYWYHALPSATSEVERWICLKHIIAMAAYVPMTPTVLAHYNSVFSQVANSVWKKGSLTIGDFDSGAMLSRMSDIQEELLPLVTSESFFSLPYGRYVSTFVFFLSFCAQASRDLRHSLKEKNIDTWCLDACQSIYASVHNDSAPMSLSVWASCALRLALTIMEDSDVAPKILCTSPGLLRGEIALLSSKNKRILTPHLPWIMKSVLPERDASFGFEVISVDFSLPITLSLGEMRHFVRRLRSIRHFILAETYNHAIPEATHVFLPHAYAVSKFPPTHDSPSTQLYDAMVVSARCSLRSVVQMARSDQDSNKQSLVGAWGPIYSFILGASNLKQNEERDARLQDILVALDDISRHVPDLLCGRSLDNAWGLHGLVLAYDSGHSSWFHKDRSVAHTLARILLRSEGARRITTLDPRSHLTYDTGCDHRTALALACAAWCPGLAPIDATSGETGIIKMSRSAVENTLAILQDVPDGVLKGRACCVRDLVKRPRISDEELDEDARVRVGEVYDALERKLQALDVAPPADD